MLLETHFIY